MVKTTPQQNLASETEMGQGIALIDKPTGVSSHYVVNHLRKRFQIKRVGHAGTLDPLATGLLICLIGRNFTKLQTHFLKQPKTYECNFSLGFTTDSYDRTGKVTSQADWSKITKVTKTLAAQALKTFLGNQTQTVPAFSAVKVGGEKMYQKILKNPELDLSTLPTRQIQITSLKLLSWQLNHRKKILTGKMAVACGSGTYIRSLVHDLGQKLEIGACVTELRRTSIGQLNVRAANKITDKTLKLYQSIEKCELISSTQS